MAKFEKERNDIIKEKNKSAVKAMDMEGKSKAFEKKRNDLEKGISRIPDDLPQELQQEVNKAIENARDNIKEEGTELADEIKDAQDDADETVENIRSKANEYKRKAQKFSRLNAVPLIGSFAETKATELNDEVEQLNDLSSEAQGYSDNLAKSRTRILNK